ncbi:uncharacterized protein LOC110007423 [Amborella trichopoda]|uniref:uncharacterized protein LOC110007423 n=1 Tax=Amborella trichopoda TaxID=13333 RepID=UPI0009BF067E|nr:uncharacterized protein LOC110007423 [Amborella trichopoda]|eukprot:XP_020524085.1 uncharacterized protein LOC110007423 [Amborella trichopoda]
MVFLSKSLPPHLVEELEKDISEEAVKHAIFVLLGDKAPRPYGFPLIFFERLWYLLKTDILLMVQEFMSTSLMRKSEQSAFIRDRMFMYIILIAQECIHSRSLQDRACVVIKLDMEKAFDRMLGHVIKIVERYMLTFIWRFVDENQRKYHLVAWDKVCTPVNMGGLGIRKLKSMNLDLLSKWWWRIIQAPITCGNKSWWLNMVLTISLTLSRRDVVVIFSPKFGKIFTALKEWSLALSGGLLAMGRTPTSGLISG